MSEGAPDRLALSEEAHHVEVEVSTLDRPAEAPTARVEVVFSREELDHLKQEAARAGTSVPALVHQLVMTRAHVRARASIGSNNVPSNPPSVPETSSGIRVRGYSGAYTAVIGRNR